MLSGLVNHSLFYESRMFQNVTKVCNLQRLLV